MRTGPGSAWKRSTSPIRRTSRHSRRPYSVRERISSRRPSTNSPSTKVRRDMPVRVLLLYLAIVMPLAAWGGNAPPLRKDYPITPVPFTAVEFTDGFWSRRIDVNRDVTLPHNFVQCGNTGRIDNFVFAAGLKRGKHTGYQFNDSDVFKVIEGASYSLLAHPDTDLVRTIDSIIVF